MRRFTFLGLLVALVAGIAYAAATRSFTETTAVAAGVATRAVPSSAPTTCGAGQSVVNQPLCPGLLLSSVKGFRCEICAASGQTLSGSGTMDLYLFSSDALLWMQNPILTRNVTNTGVRCQAFDDFEPIALIAGDYVLCAPNNVAVSGGATVTTWHRAGF